MSNSENEPLPIIVPLFAAAMVVAFIYGAYSIGVEQGRHRSVVEACEQRGGVWVRDTCLKKNWRIESGLK